MDTEQRRNLYNVIIGSDGVSLALRLQELDASIRGKNTEIRNAKAVVQQHIPPGTDFDVFMSFQRDDAIDQKIEEKEREFASARQVETVRQRAALAGIVLPAFPEGDVSQLLAKSLEGVAADAEARIAAQIEKHGMRSFGEGWLAGGVPYIREDACPFCGQNVAGNALVEAYRAYFSESYDQFKVEIDALLNAVGEELGDRAIAAVERTLEQNSAAVEFWSSHCNFDPPTLESRGAVEENLRATRLAAIEILERKRAAPLEVLELNRAVEVSQLGRLREIGQEVDRYNAAVESANLAIDAKKTAVENSNVQSVQSELTRLQAVKARHTDRASDVCTRLLRLQLEKARLEERKEETKTRLDEHTESVIAPYEQLINRYLDRINAGFRITRTTHNYRGGVASSSYQILINGEAVDVGDAKTPLDRPSFKNTLSAGDRSTLALALFLAQLESDPNRADKIVVFDDPFTSQDSFRRSHTAQQIKNCGRDCSQVIVLSHDPAFLKVLWDLLRPLSEGCKTLQLVRLAEQNTAIAEWDIEKALQARYRADLEAMQRFYSDGEGDARVIIQKIRPVLEGYCRNGYPSHFAEMDTLGGILEKIRNGGQQHPLKSIRDDLEELNSYTSRYHHGENHNPGLEAIDDGELNGYVKRTLGLVGAL